jgi:cellulose 1,4-beta-cellobiosidase
MDIWEANSAATAFTPHPCNIAGTYACTGGLCGAGTYHDEGVCDEEGCDFNPHRMGNETFYGSNLIVDTTKPFTVVTQFITSDGTAAGTLSQINRLYVQNGVVIQNSNVTIPGIIPVNDITDQYCTSQKAAFDSTNPLDSEEAWLSSVKLWAVAWSSFSVFEKTLGVICYGLIVPIL